MINISINIISAEFVLILQYISIIGYFILAGYTFVSYHRIKNRMLMFISLGFATISISIILLIFITPILAIFIQESYIEAIFEGTQFVAAFFFFYGLRLIKNKNQEAT